VLTLHSRPGAHTRIYLDFDGAEVSNTEWNVPTATTSGTPSGFYPGYSTDADPAFSATERDVVARTWAEVAEDYAPFKVDVTTEDPGDAGLQRSSSSDTDYGVRVLVTGADPATTSLCQGCSGIAYIGVFDEPTTAADPFPHQPIHRRGLHVRNPQRVDRIIPLLVRDDQDDVRAIRGHGSGSSARVSVLFPDPLEPTRAATGSCGSPRQTSC
jgi:hypothetical protein